MSLPRYPEYKESGVAWLGVVPAHWEVSTLRRVTVDKCDGPFGSGIKSEHYTDEGVLVVRLQNIRAGRFHYGEPVFLSQSYFESELRGHEVLPGDVLVAGLGDENNLLGRACVAPLGLGDALVKADCFRFRLESYRVLSSFVAMQLSASAQSDAGMLASGTTRSRIPLSTMQTRRLALPPLEEQTAIASFLDRETDKIDALVAEQAKLLTLLAEKRQATISHAVTKGLNPDAPMKESGVEWLGKVPAQWRIRPLKQLVSFSSGGTPSKENLDYWNGDVPWASAKDLKVETLHDTEDHITQHALSTGAASMLPAGSVLVVVRGMILARTFPVTRTAVPMAINQDLKGLQATESLNAGFLTWLLRGSADESLRRLDEAGHGTKALRMDVWSSMQLPVPPTGEQADIITFLDAETARLDALTAEATRAIALLKERRSALISAAVTGKIDVRNTLPPQEACHA